MNQIWKYSLFALALALSVVSNARAKAIPVQCYDLKSQITIVEGTYTEETKGNNTFIEFDFTEDHKICLRDSNGTPVTGTSVGHVKEKLGPGGQLDLQADEVLCYGSIMINLDDVSCTADSTIDLSAVASSDGTNWHSLVHSVGNSGTGEFENLRVTGSFSFTSPTGVLADLDLFYH